MSWWQVAVIANGAVAAAYAAIGGTVLRRVHASRQWRSNPLAVTTGAIFLACAANHSGHLAQLLLPGSAGAARGLWSWPLTAIDIVGALIAARYWTLRARRGGLLHGPTLFEDVSRRQRDAFDIQDGIVQHLATAKMAFELGDTRLGMRELDTALRSSRQLMSERHGIAAERTAGARPGDLRREVVGR